MDQSPHNEEAVAPVQGDGFGDGLAFDEHHGSNATAAPAPEQTVVPQAEQITVLLTARGEKATKTFYRVGSEPIAGTVYHVPDGSGSSYRVGVRNYDNHFRYTYQTRPVDGIHSLSALLTKLSAVPNAFVIRGEAIPEANPPGSSNPRRSQPRAAADGKPAEPATYRAVERRWIALDMDKVPGRIDPSTDPEGAARYLIGLLPAEFHGVTCHVQWTSSQGMAPPGTLSARLWYWLEEPTGDQTLRAWAKSKNAVIKQRLGFDGSRALLDPSLFNAVQPHYTAAPIFLDDIADPLPQRSFLLAGGAETVRIEFRGADLPAKGLAETIRTFGQDGLHGSLKALAVAYARETTDEAERTPEKLLALMHECLNRYDGDRIREIPAYLADVRKYLDLAEWALKTIPHIPRRIADINKVHFVSREAGKVRVFNEEWDDALKRRILTRSSFTDFANFNNNEFVAIKRGEDIKWERLGKFWLEHPQRRQYDRIAFNPDGVEEGAYNLWRGWAIGPEEGDWSLLKAHIRDNACAGNEKLFDYILDWLANLFQNPAEPGKVAIVLKGNKGTGKGKIAEWVLKACGQHGLQISNSRHLVGNFNAHLRDCVFLFADEAFWAGDKQGDSVLKTLVTERLIAVEAKGVDVVMAKNMLHIMMASNADWVVPASHDERRYAVFQMSDAHQQDHPYFAAIDKQMESGGLAAMLHELMHREYDPKALLVVPQTEALRDQQQLSMPADTKWWYEKVYNGELLPGNGFKNWAEAPQSVMRDLLHRDFRDSMHGHSASVDRTDETALGIYLKKFVPSLDKRQCTVAIGGIKVRKWFWVIPPLAECRAHFDRISGRSWPWPNLAECEDIPVIDPYADGFPTE